MTGNVYVNRDGHRRSRIRLPTIPAPTACIDSAEDEFHARVWRVIER